MAFYPRKRASRIYPTVKTVKADGETKLPVFAGYKAGMTHIIALDTYQNSPTYGHKISIPVTIVETPPLRIFGIRLYKSNDYGALNCIGELLSEKLEKDLGRKITLPKKYDIKKREEEITKELNDAKSIRVMVHTQPRKIGLKKKPELFEIPLLGNTIDEMWKFAREMLGKDVDISSVFNEGDFVDVVAVTKGKGTQGPVKRFGIKIQPRKNKGHRRFPGAIGAWTPSRVLWTVPMQGQMGFQRRTELNKRILKIGDKPEEINPKGGIPHYGLIRASYVLLQGSIPGPKKRLVVFRKAIRQNKEKPMPSILEISLEPKQ